jgi:hypothetical protein
MSDVVGDNDMAQGSSTSFVADRFGNVNSALALNGGWTQIPQGIYFNTSEFTVSVWVYPMSVGSYSRIIDFGNGPNADNIIFSLTQSNSLQPLFQFYTGLDLFLTTISNIQITLNQWQFLTVTFNGTNARIYSNGILIGESNTQNNIRTLNLSRSNCFIGKSNWAENDYSHSYLDDLRFYNKSLTQEQINELMDYYQYETSLCFKLTICFFLN